MSHTLSRIWLHAVLGTKNKAPLLQPVYESRIYGYMSTKFEEMDCLVQKINGVEDHVHVLFSLSLNHAIASVLQKVKGSSAHFINQQQLCDQKFEWQVGYGIFSVSESMVPGVCAYIENQKQHHQFYTTQQEADQIKRLHNIPISKPKFRKTA